MMIDRNTYSQATFYLSGLKRSQVKPWIKNSRLDQAIRESVLKDMGGVIVGLAPSSFGMSENTKSTLMDMMEEESISGAIYGRLGGYTGDPVVVQVNKALQIKPELDLVSLTSHYSECITDVIVIDQVELLLGPGVKKEDRAQALSFFTHLALSSCSDWGQNRRYKFILLTNDKETATSLVACNGGSKLWALAQGTSMIGGSEHENHPHWRLGGIQWLPSDVEAFLKAYILQKDSKFILPNTTNDRSLIDTDVWTQMIKIGIVSNRITIFSRIVDELFLSHDGGFKYIGDNKAHYKLNDLEKMAHIDAGMWYKFSQFEQLAHDRVSEVYGL